MMKNARSFDDVLLVPKYSDIKSRSEVDVGNFLDDTIYLGLPVISSPMDTVSEFEMLKAMYDEGGLGVAHRYNTIEDQIMLIKKAAIPYTAAAIGVTGDFEARACALWDAGVRVICLDVAHGHHILVKNALETLRGIFGDGAHLMAGNVATLEAFNDLADWGADSIRVGIGGGSICSTRLNTGHGVPTLQSIIDCSYTNRDAKLIADGGIKNSGDIVKALAAGADFVMLGSMLAGTGESPGELLSNEKGEKYKVYRGMASVDAQIDWRGNSSSPEGISTIIPYKGTVHEVVKDVVGGIRSGLSYTGAKDIRELQARAEFIAQTPAGQKESGTHILWSYK